MSTLNVEYARKNPKEMTIEELEEYILKNKVSNHESNKYSSEKALTEVGNYSRNLNREIPINDTSFNDNKGDRNYEENPSRLKSSHNMLQSNLSSQMEINKFSNVFNPFIANSSEIDTKEVNPEKIDSVKSRSRAFLENSLTTNDQNKINNRALEDDQSNQPIKTELITSKGKSNAAKNALSAYQEKIANLELRNRNLEEEISKLRELNTNERRKFNEDFYQFKNRENHSEEMLIKRLNESENLLESMKRELNGASNKINYLNRVTSMLEQEKERHLEQNAKEKEDHIIEIESLSSELNELKGLYRNISQENDELRNSNKSNSDLTEKLRRENERLKLLIQHYEDERRDMLDDIDSLRNINSKIENEKSILFKKLRQVKQLRVSSGKSNCNKISKCSSEKKYDNNRDHGCESTNKKAKKTKPQSDVLSAHSKLNPVRKIPEQNDLKESYKRAKNKRSNSLSHRDNPNESSRISNNKNPKTKKSSSMKMRDSSIKHFTEGNKKRIDYNYNEEEKVVDNDENGMNFIT